MIILRHDEVSAEDLFVIERVMLKISANPYQHSLKYSLLTKPRGEVYGFIAGIFKRMEVYQTLGVTTSGFLEFLMDIEKGYNDNPYHSFYHAVDVTMVLYHMFEQYGTSEYIARVDIALALIAALCHDIGHPGKNNQFEVSSKTETAKKYHDLSVLECQSSTMALELLDKHNLLRNIESRSRAFGIPITQHECRTSIVEMILATDMVCHFKLQDNISTLREIVSNSKESSQIRKAFQNTIFIDKQKQDLKPLFPAEDDLNPFTYFKQHYFDDKKSPSNITNMYTACKNNVLNQQERFMLCKILIHAADISNPCRPWPIFHQLSKLVCIEFFRQGEEEYRLGLPISPNMNRHEANPSSVNVEFIDFVVQPYFEALSALFPKCQELAVQCASNRGEWLKFSSEKVDIFGNKLLPIEVALGGSITKQVTLSAGIVQIPEYIEEDILTSFDTLNEPEWLISPYLEEDMTSHSKGRRKSEEVSILHQTNHRSRSSISKGRRKSEELSIL